MPLTQTRSCFTQQAGNIDGTLDGNRHAVERSERCLCGHRRIRHFRLQNCPLLIDGHECMEFGVQLVNSAKLRGNEFDYGKLALANPCRHFPRRKANRFIHGFWHA
ncbi:hypothetical protein D3C83_56360 [compost metagenome]